MTDCEELIRPALSSVLDSYEIRPAESHCTVVTPFQHPNGDLITIHVQGREGDYYDIRDFGEVFAMLRLYGVDPSSRSRERRIEHIQDQFNLDNVDGELKIRARESELGDRILDMVQATQAVTYLVYTHQTQQPSRFQTEVESFLTDVGYDYERTPTIKGETHSRDFAIGINHREPTILLDTIHSNDEYNLRQQADGVMLNWHEVHNLDYSHGVVVDNVDGVFEESILSSLIDNLDYFFTWNEKEAITQEIPVKAH